jgi:alpha-methylacyl-CoA racemase
MSRPQPGPLAGLRVLEFGGIGPAPLAGMLLADLGASVVRINRPRNPSVPPTPSQIMDSLGRGKRALALDMREPGTAAALLDRMTDTDVLLEGFRPGVMERLGLGPDLCQARNPALVYGRVTGYGQTGPLAAKAGHDINYIALAGALGAIGTKQAPVVPLNLIADYGGGALYLAMGVLAGLNQARNSGRGPVIDAAMVDGVVSLLAVYWPLLQFGHWQPERQSNIIDGTAPFYGTYRTSDGGHVAVGAIEPQFFAELLRLLDLDPSWRARQNDRTAWPELRALMAERFAARTREEWTARADAFDCCLTPVLNLDEVGAHPHIRARNALVEQDGMIQTAIAPRLSGMEARPVNGPARAITLPEWKVLWARP